MHLDLSVHEGHMATLVQLASRSPLNRLLELFPQREETEQEPAKCLRRKRLSA